jgi:hypothetical protein
MGNGKKAALSSSVTGPFLGSGTPVRNLVKYGGAGAIDERVSGVKR